MTDAEKIPPGDLNENRRRVKDRLRSFRMDPLTFNLYSVVREIDDEDPDLMLVEETLALRAVEDGLAFYFALFHRMENLLEVPALRADKARDRGVLEHRLEFAVLYSLFAATSIIVQKTAAIRAGLDPDSLRQWPLEVENVSVEANEIRSFNNVVSRYLVDLCEKRGDGTRLVSSMPDFVCLTHDYFQALSDRCLRLRDRYLDLVPLVEDRHFMVDDVTVSGFEVQARVEEEIEIHGETFEEMVGNRELKQVLRTLADKLLLYDTRTRRNPAKELGDFTRTLLLYGRPGTGKTMAIGALIIELTERARRLGKPFKPVLVGSDIKDKYFGESVKNLKRKLSELHRGDRIALVAIEDIDLMIASRDDQHVSTAEKDILHELMNTLEGIASKDMGNAVIVATTNDPAGIEGALVERLQENPVEVRGPETADDFTALFKMKLRKGMPDNKEQGATGAGYVVVKDKGSGSRPGWREIGKACLEADFTGRPVKNICKRLMTLASDFEVPEEVYGLEVEQARERLSALYQKIDGRLVMEEIKRYQTHSRAHEEAMHEQRIRERKKRILIELHAGKMADEEWKKGD